MGTLSLSVEIELGWGQIQEPIDYRFNNLSGPDREAETERLRDLLDVCDEYGIPVSFDVVGHLLLSECNGEHDGPHTNGWFDIDPGTDVETDPLFYAPDLVEMIRGADTDHEICTHTFSHVPCKEVPPEVVTWELDEAARLHEDAGLPAPASFVPPWHEVPSTELLTARDIETVRVSDGNDTTNRLASMCWKMTQFVSFLSRSPVSREPNEHDGLCRVSTQAGPTLTSFALPHGSRQPHPLFRAIPISVRKRAHHNYLTEVERLVRGESTHVHLSSHLYDLGNDHQWACVQPFLEAVGESRRLGRVIVKTMNSLCE